ncbi:MAG TPA: hypothetical protein VF545_12965 [Thermoleophilaceae bacterium]|jgi:hypothetical protein
MNRLVRPLWLGAAYAALLVVLGPLSAAVARDLFGMLFAVIAVSAVFGYRIGRWPAVLLAPLAPVAMLPFGHGDLEVDLLGLALLIFPPAAAVAVAAGVGARKAVSGADAKRAETAAPPDAGLAALPPPAEGTRVPLPAPPDATASPPALAIDPRRAALALAIAAAGVLWLVKAWFVLRAGIDPQVACDAEPCLGAPAQRGGDRTALTIGYGVVQAAIAGVGLFAAGALVPRALGLTPRPPHGPARVAAVALCCWIAVVLAGSVLSGPGPAEAARSGELVIGDPDSPSGKLSACREALPFHTIDLGEEFQGMRLDYVRCSGGGFPTFQAMYRAGDTPGGAQVYLDEHVPLPNELGMSHCPAPDTGVAAVDQPGSRVLAVRGVAAVRTERPNELRVVTRDVSVVIGLDGAPGVDPLALAAALRPTGERPGAPLAPAAGSSTCPRAPGPH